MCLVLSQDEDGGNIGVREIAEDKIDDPVLATERYGGLGAIGGQRVETLALSSGEHQRENSGGELSHDASWNLLGGWTILTAEDCSRLRRKL